MADLSDYGIEFDDEGRIVGFQAGKAAALLEWMHRKDAEEFKRLERACMLANEWRKQQNYKRGWVNSKAAVGLCRCGAEVEDGRRSCRHCIDINNAASARYKSRKSGADDIPLRQRPRAQTDPERAAVIERRLMKRRVGSRLAAIDVLAAFDKMTPGEFRSWLTEATGQSGDRKKVA